jgi:hypothetical protein
MNPAAVIAVGELVDLAEPAGAVYRIDPLGRQQLVTQGRLWVRPNSFAIINQRPLPRLTAPNSCRENLLPDTPVTTNPARFNPLRNWGSDPLSYR